MRPTLYLVIERRNGSPTTTEDYANHESEQRYYRMTQPVTVLDVVCLVAIAVVIVFALCQ